MRLSELILVCSKQELAHIPEGKVLINTINAHSYNVAQKDKVFAESLNPCGYENEDENEKYNEDENEKGGECRKYLIPDGASIVKACRWLKGKSQPKERIAGWDLFAFEMQRMNENQNENRKRQVMFMGSSEEVLEKIRQRAAVDYPNLEIVTYSPPYKAEFSDEDNTLERVGHPLPCGYHRCGVRLLCRNGTEGSTMVAEALLGMALPTCQGAKADVAQVCHWQPALHLQNYQRENDK